MDSKLIEEYWKEKDNSYIARKVAYNCAYERMTELLLASKNVDQFFENLGINRIAIYGVEGLGRNFHKFISNSNIKVDCFIDRNYKKYNQKNFIVIGIDQLVKSNIQGIVIAVLDHQCQIIKELVNAGFDINRIFTVNTVLYGVSTEK